jgi:predicted MFS family arabinose efflux permease
MQDSSRLTTPLLWLFTVASGVSVANLYYNQPLLPEIAATFGVTATQAGAVATATQVGYAAGLLLFVPLGDVKDRRRLILVLLGAVVASLLAAGAAPSLPLMIAASVAVGMTTVVPQVLIPLAAGMAPEGGRGRVVGQIMAGLLVGILAARTVSGFVGHLLGWRAMFVVAAVLMGLLLLSLARWLPSAPPLHAAGEGPSYGSLLLSLGSLAREQPVLRETALMGALFFAAFSAFWTTLGFHLAAPPLRYGPEVAGAFGVLGIAGALAAPLAGRFADRGRPRTAVSLALGANVAAWIALLAAGHTLAGIAVGVILLDAGTQAAQVSNQSRIYALPAALHSRLNTVYMVAYFCGGAAGSVLGSLAWSAGGWEGVCLVALGMLGAAALVFVLSRPRQSE